MGIFWRLLAPKPVKSTPDSKEGHPSSARRLARRDGQEDRASSAQRRPSLPQLGEKRW